METAEQDLTEAAPMLPELDSQSKPVVHYITTHEYVSPEITIIREKHPSTKERRFWAEVLGENVAKDNPVNSKTRILVLAQTELERIREERNAKAVAKWDAMQAAKVQPAVSDVVAETVVQLEADEKQLVVEQWAGVNSSPDVPADAALEAEFEDAVTGGLDVE